MNEISKLGCMWIVRHLSAVVVMFALFATVSVSFADSELSLRRQLTFVGQIEVIGNTLMKCDENVATKNTVTGSNERLNNNGAVLVDKGTGAECTATLADNTDAGGLIKQNFFFQSMDWINNAGGVVNSTSATLTLPPGTNTIRAAYLYWGGWSDGTISINGSTDRGKARLKVPGGTFQTVIAEETFTSLVAGGGTGDRPCDNNTSAPPADAAIAAAGSNVVNGASNNGFTFYQSVADVTALVKAAGAGSYAVGDIVGLTGPGALALNIALDPYEGSKIISAPVGAVSGRGTSNCSAGWTMVVMAENPSVSGGTRSLSLFDGLIGLASTDTAKTTTVTGFKTPATGAYDAQIGIVAYDGDGDVGDGGGAISDGDQFKIGPTGGTSTNQGTGDDTGLNPFQNFFNSTNTRQARGGALASYTNRTPNDLNMLGLDIDTITPANAATVLGNGTTSLDLVFTTGNEFLLPGLLILDVPTDVANLSIAKTGSPSNAAIGEEILFRINVGNAGPATATGVVMRDPRDAADTFTVLGNPHETFPAGLLITSVETAQGTCQIKNATGTVQHAAAATITVPNNTDVSTANDESLQMVDCALGSIAIGGSVEVKIKLKVTAAFLNGAKAKSFTNIASADASEGDTVEAEDAASVAIITEDVLLAGRVWEDTNHDRVLDDNETLRSGWIVNILDPATGNVLATKTTDSDGRYSFTSNDIAPGTYNVQFLSASNSTLGKAVSNTQSGSTTSPGNVNDNVGSITSITLTDGDNIIEQNLPLDPSGVVYNSSNGNLIAGATVTIAGPAGFDPNIHLATGQQGQVTGTDGFYRFDINQAAGAPTGVYTISVVPPAGFSFISTVIPPSGTLDVPSSLVVDPFLVVAGTGPDLAGVTTYYLTFLFDGNDTNVVNNHIPLDPASTTASIVIAKSTPKETVVKGDIVPYTIGATNVTTNTFSNTAIVDTIPPGFKYVAGSATLDGVALEPVVSGRTLTWSPITFATAQSHTIQMLLVVGSGVDVGKYINTVQVNDSIGNRLSNVATATVVVVADPITDCSDIIGQVFNDLNSNAYQDEGEPGIPGVRVVTVNGLKITTDQYGRYHVACADIPQIDRGSNFILKVDERTLPTGFRMTSENPRVVRTTRGTLVKANFAAALVKVVRVQLDQRAFEANNPQLKAEWAKQGLAKIVDALVKEGQKGLLRLVYWVEDEEEDLVNARVDWMIEKITDLWSEEDDRPPLTIEKEIRSKGVAAGSIQ